MTKRLWILTALAPLLILGVGMGCKGCKQGPDVDTPPVEPYAGSGSGETKSTPGKPASQGPSDVESTPPIKPAGEWLSPGKTGNNTRIIYFDYDKSDIRSDQMPNVEWNAEWLKKNPQYQVRVEGHCDERGTEEYNVALGDRRARSIKKQLMYLGVDPTRLFVVSYGEMNPAVEGHNEEAWAKNRRVELWISRQK